MYSTTQQSPHLVPNLRIALSTLYSLPTPFREDQHSSSQAHEYLLHFQARNPRRDLHSKQSNQKQGQHQTTNKFLDVGSTWLACVAVLSSLSNDANPNTTNVHYIEALFAAQTLVHRLRRTKLAEAIDLEFEPHVFDTSPIMWTHPDPEQVFGAYQKWILQYYHGTSNSSSFGILLQLISDYRPAIDPQQKCNELEERIKGEISMIVIASIMDVLTKSSLQQAQQQTLPSVFAQIRPLLKTMASILALIAARIRYVSTSLPSPAPHTEPIVTTILGVISMLQPREHDHCQDPHQVQESAESLSFVCLTVLPEAILTGSSGNNNVGGGAYGRFSLDPRCYAAVTAELKTQGMNQMCLSIQTILNAPNRHVSPTLILQMCEAWAKYVSLPIDFVSATVPLVLGVWDQFRFSHPSQSQSALQMKSAMAYWIAIMEAGTWSVDQVLTSSLVQSKERSQQPNKKRQSSRSKKRHQQFLEENATNELLISARKEVDHRGLVACAMAQQTLTVLKELLVVELRRISKSDVQTDDQEEDFQGDGPVGAITTCADACLPYLLRTSVVYEDTTSIALFTTISNLIQQVCTSPSRLVRSFVAESLYSLHEALVKTLIDCQNKQLTVDFSEMVINHFFQSSFSLAFRCGYPRGFFDDLGQDNDEELESERNDVRDLLRTISGIPNLVDGHNSVSLIYVGSSILLRLMQACALPVREAVASNSLFPELALHTFSALAKPINSAAILYSKNVLPKKFENNIASILNLALEIASNAGKCLLHAFPIASINEVLPLSRLYNLAVSSLAPMFSTLCQIHSTKQAVETTVKIGINAAATSLLKLPELTGPSTLRQTRFDIRGAMRSPGGEDHGKLEQTLIIPSHVLTHLFLFHVYNVSKLSLKVGVLTLMRLANESMQLSLVFLRTNDSILVELCKIHEALKAIEDQRGVGFFYGVGVLPKSRRILLDVICGLAVLPGANNQASRLLTDIFEKAVSSIVSAKPHLQNLGFESLSRICESTFDIAAFSPNTILSLFSTANGENLQGMCLHVLHKAGNIGFLFPHDSSEGSDVIIAWNRLRAALFILLKKIGNPDLPSSVVGILISFITIECEAATIQFSKGPLSSSRIFHEDVVSEESIPPGLFIRAMAETFDRAFSLQVPLSLMRNTLHVLYTTRHSVMNLLLAECPEPVQKGSFHDPRPIVAETWFQSMNRIAKEKSARELVKVDENIELGISSVCMELFVETFVVSITLLLYTSLGKTQQKRANDPGMSLDGPQGLVMMEFFVLFMNLGVSMIRAGARKLGSLVPVNAGDNLEEAGIAIIGAALFRGSQGGLPPWAVESVPSIYSSLFNAFNKDVDSFGRIFEISMAIRLADEKRFGSVQGGSLLSGKFFEKMTEKTKLNFINQAKDIARIDTAASWRRLKSLIKQACGGKKKDTDFKQRPALTTWDTLDRV